MLKTALKTLVGSRHKREAKKLQPLVGEINSFFEGLSTLTDEELKAKVKEGEDAIKAAEEKFSEIMNGLTKRYKDLSDQKEEDEKKVKDEGLTLAKAVLEYKKSKGLF